KKVVGHAQTRVDIFPIRRVLHRWKVACRYENPRRQCLRRHCAVQAIVTQPEVEGSSSQRPLVLRKQTEAGRLLEKFERRRPDRDRYGDPVSKSVGPGLVDLVEVCVSAGTAKVVALIREARLEIM